jgi:anthranilate synthase/aminodeoxychorismate synthase-like glutamine amidotransferase
MILLIDNYDSFTWNLVQRIGELDAGLDVRVIRNDEITADEAAALSPERVIVSPGPCTPGEAGVSSDIVRTFAGRVPVLGVCLGHQCIGAVHGMDVARHRVIMHGKTSPVHHDARGVFRGLSNPFIATRYHSLVVRAQDERVAPGWELSAWAFEQDTGEKVIMGLRKPGQDGAAEVEGVQFHPESFLTAEGPKLLANFLGLPWPSGVWRDRPLGLEAVGAGELGVVSAGKRDAADPV